MVIPAAAAGTVQDLPSVTMLRPVVPVSPVLTAVWPTMPADTVSLLSFRFRRMPKAAVGTNCLGGSKAAGVLAAVVPASSGLTSASFPLQPPSSAMVAKPVTTA
ncbi:hypothetical protein [Kribbella sp. CA-247076]|uniref:hypothetical protein n=1 Tax=Kribbella sp. CA-247076 TaxID=3239941 RepID=UPI003D8D9791